jgi:hypothetical protein
MACPGDAAAAEFAGVVAAGLLAEGPGVACVAAERLGDGDVTGAFVAFAAAFEAFPVAFVAACEPACWDVAEPLAAFPFPFPVARCCWPVADAREL